MCKDALPTAQENLEGNPMKALIDADILPYEYGGMVQLEEPDKPLEWEIVRSMVDDRINQIVEATGADSLSLYLTDSPSNFRVKLATILPYKGHRKQEKPYHWQRIRQHLIDNWDAKVQYGIEADDRLGIEQWKDWQKKEDCLRQPEIPPTCCLSETVICSRDKDLDMIPGWHYVWQCGNQKEKHWFQDELSAIRSFYRQLLTGDTSDNILGLFGVGSSSKLVKRLEDFDEESLMFKHVLKAYKDRFGSYCTQFLYENAALLWIKRRELLLSEEAVYEIQERLNILLSELDNDNLG